MRCFHPIYVKVKKPFAAPPRSSPEYRAWLIRPVASNVIQEVPCGRCPACLRRRQNAWACRIQKEAEVSAFTCFLTLTIDDQHLTYGYGEPTLVKSDVQIFLKLFRQSFCRIVGRSDSGVRFFACGEYGDTFGRPHYHMILFFKEMLLPKEQIYDLVGKTWKLGFVKCDAFSLARSRYVAKYCCKVDGVDYDSKGVLPPFALMSRRPGIGDCYKTPENVRRYQITQAHLISDSKGVLQCLPRFYSEYFFSPDQRRAYSEACIAAQDAKDMFDDALNPGDLLRKFYSRSNLSNYESYYRTLELEKKRFRGVLQASYNL